MLQMAACLAFLGRNLAADPRQCGGGHQQCSLEDLSATGQVESRTSGPAMLQAHASLSKTADTSAGMTCAIEEKAKNVVEFIIWNMHNMPMPTRPYEIPQHSNFKTLASIIRSVFHDAQDHNNLVLEDETGRLYAIDSAKSGIYGGVDGCLYIPFPNWHWGSWIHKKELNYGLDFITLYTDDDALHARVAGKFAIEACEILCCTEGHLTTAEKHTLCGPELSICNPKVPHSWDTWHQHHQEPNWIHSMDDMLKDKCVVDMHVLGAALVTKKVGGPQIEMTWGRHQADCNKRFQTSKASETLRPFPIWLNAAPPGSFDSLHKVVEDFARMGFSEREMAALMGAHSFGKIHKYAGDFAPRQNHTGFCNSNRTEWGQGGYWDKTPDKLDNDYFKGLDTIDPAEKEVCCADRNQYGCRTTKSKPGAPMQFWNGSVVPGQGCNHKWCMRSSTPWYPRNKDEAKGATLTTQEAMPQWNEKKYGKAPPVRRYMLAADWALLESPLARAAVKEFAQSEEVFSSAYNQAFDKMTKLGYPPAAINTCSGPRPQTELLHAGEACWSGCSGKKGFCDWCGSGGACCKKGAGWDPLECRYVTNWNPKMWSHHHCVKTFAVKSAMNHTSKLLRHGKECWKMCNSNSGYCDKCGSSGACCKNNRNKKMDKAECQRAIGFTSHQGHQCVLVP